MKLDEIKQRYGNAIPTKHHRDEEHRIQCACVRWFRLEHPYLALFAVPNGGKRDVVTATRLRDEGAMPGVSDLILMYPTGKYHALCIEMKTDKGHQSEYQKKFQTMVEELGYLYIICRSLEDFRIQINKYLYED